MGGVVRGGLFLGMGLVVGVLLMVSGYRVRSAKMYELEMRVFYLEDVLAKYYYGDGISDQYQFDMTDK